MEMDKWMALAIKNIIYIGYTPPSSTFFHFSANLTVTTSYYRQHTVSPRTAASISGEGTPPITTSYYRHLLPPAYRFSTYRHQQSGRDTGHTAAR